MPRNNNGVASRISSFVADEQLGKFRSPQRMDEHFDDFVTMLNDTAPASALLAKLDKQNVSAFWQATLGVATPGESRTALELGDVARLTDEQLQTRLDAAQNAAMQSSEDALTAYQGVVATQMADKAPKTHTHEIAGVNGLADILAKVVLKETSGAVADLTVTNLTANTLSVTPAPGEDSILSLNDAQGEPELDIFWDYETGKAKVKEHGLTVSEGDMVHTGNLEATIKDYVNTLITSAIAGEGGFPVRLGAQQETEITWTEDNSTPYSEPKSEAPAGHVLVGVGTIWSVNTIPESSTVTTRYVKRIYHRPIEVLNGTDWETITQEGN